MTVAGAVAGCSGRAASERPSVLLVVFDTLRADAVSAYGAVAGTTPNVDALAATGLRYTRAHAPAPWTMPSHVTLFTGLGVEHHHVGMSERITAPAELVMLAERLRDAGYDTAGFVGERRRRTRRAPAPAATRNSAGGAR
ncbi:MAG TPA: sulfatase-like hydrolase/transferase [Candidatus Binatia bacterium]|nr:sulfatase-like hydrolase/transferase [Candidatus Binatia bacterium]